MANNEAVQSLKLADSYLTEVEEAIRQTELNESAGRELLNTIQLAIKQVDKAARTDSAAQLDGIGITFFRARAFGDRGILENNALGRRSAAILSLRTSIELCDHIPDAHYAIGLIYSHTGKKEDALRHLRRAVDLSSDDMEYRKTLDRIENAPKLGMQLGAFRGSWKVMVVLVGFTLIGLIMMVAMPILVGEIGAIVPGIINFIFWGGIAFLYWKVKSA